MLSLLTVLDERHDDGFLVFCAVIVGLIPVAIVLIDPSDSSGVLTWLITVVLVVVGYKLTAHIVQSAWGDGARGRAFAMASVGLVCLYLVIQVVPWDDMGLSIDPRGTAGDPPSAPLSDDTDGDHVPNGSDANPTDPTIQVNDDYR